MSEAIRAAPPVRDLGLLDLVAAVVGRVQTRGLADRAVDVDHAPTDSADQMVMVVADAILEARRRSRGLNAPDQPFGDQNAERVVDRLERDGTDLGAHSLGHSVGGDVRLTRYSPQNRQPLGSDLNSALPKEVCRVSRHTEY